jgi:predicted metal-dependent hydrolase
MNIAEKALTQLLPNKTENRNVRVKYSAKFNDYNANVKYSNNFIEFSLSKKWQGVSEEIVIGLIQTLLLKLYKEKNSTINIELYNKFIKNMTKYAKVHSINPLLEESFNRLNEEYFNGFMNKPNLVFGEKAFSKLGHYEYGTDTVVISSLLKEDPELMNYVLYHELLHKKHKFHSKNGRSYHHTKRFREDEKKYKDKNAEKKLKKFLVKKRIRKAFRFW